MQKDEDIQVPCNAQNVLRVILWVSLSQRLLVFDASLSDLDDINVDNYNYSSVVNT